MPTLEEIEGGKIKIGNTNYDLDEIAYGPSLEVIWPLTITYAIVENSITIHYSEDKNGNPASMIRADGYNYAYATANVQVFRNGALYTTLQNQRLTPITLTEYGGTEPSDDFYIADVSGSPVIKAYHLHTEHRGNRTLCTVEWGFADAPTVTISTQAMAVAQEANDVDQTFTVDALIASYDGNSTITTLDIPSQGQSGIALYIYARYYITGTYTSGDPMVPYRETMAVSTPSAGSYPPPDVSVTNWGGGPSVVVDYNGTYYTLSFPENQSTDTNYEYDIDINYHGAYTYLTATLYAADSYYTYDQLTVSDFYYWDGENPGSNNMIPAGGGSRIPYVTFSLRCKHNGVVQATLTGVMNSGEMTGVATDQYGVFTADVSLEYSGTGMEEDGVVTAPSKGTNVSGQTTVASGLKVRIKKGNATSSWKNASNNQRVLQQANSATKTSDGSFTVTNFYFETSPASIPSAAPTVVTITARASGNGTLAAYSYTSGATSGGEATSLNNDIVSPSSLSVAGATVTNSQFTASNKHSTNPKTWTISGTFEGTSATKTITQAADQKIMSSGEYTTTLTLDTNGIWAGGGDALLIARAVFVAGLIWESDHTEAGGNTTVGYEEQVTLAEVTGSSGVDSITAIGVDSTNHTKTFRVTHRDMAKNETTDTIKVKANNGTLSESSEWSFSVTNSKTNVLIEATPWGNFTPNGQTRPVNRNYTVSISASRFASNADAAPFDEGSYSVLIYSGHHEHSDFILGTETRTCYYKYTSWYEGSSNYYPMTEERAAEREGEWEGRTDLMPTITSGDTSIATISASDNHIVHFAANSGNANRSVLITAVNGDASASVRLYQSRFMSLTIDPNEALIFDSEAGTLYFNVVSKNTKWRITKDGDWMTVSPTSGGSSNQQDTVRISVAVPANTSDVARIGEIDILQNDTPVLFDPIMLDTLQISSQPATSYIGFVNAGWISETSIMYQLSIKNELNYKAFSGTYINVVSTASASDNPAEGQLEASYEVGTVYADGHQTSLVDQGIISNIRRDYSRTYWVKVEQIDITSSYEQIEEAATGE